MSITIEKAKSSDAAALLDYLKQIGKETDNLTFGEEGIPLTVEQEAAYITKLENSKDSLMLIAKENGRIVGNASLNRLTRRMSHRGELAVSVLKDYWNNGIGSQFMSYIIDFAKENSFEFVDLQVRSDNLSAIHLYEKFGFKKICTYPAYFKIKDQNIDFDFMQLSLK
ncbi:MAG: GNAT family N-acetyltransferase [Traorella sp.]